MPRGDRETSPEVKSVPMNIHHNVIHFYRVLRYVIKADRPGIKVVPRTFITVEIDVWCTTPRYGHILVGAQRIRICHRDTQTRVCTVCGNRCGSERDAYAYEDKIRVMCELK